MVVIALGVSHKNATFPFPQVFGLRRLRGNPPCSLWLQSVHWTNCFTRRAHIAVPPCKGTHGDRAAGDNSTRLTQSVTIAIPSLRSLRSRHNQRHFSYCATSLCAPATQQHGAVACTLTSSPTLDLLAAVAARVTSSKLHISFTNKKCVREIKNKKDAL